MDKKMLKRTALGGILDNPVFVLVLGMCPLIAVSTSFMDALLMGVSTAIVLLLSNVAISALRKITPSAVRLPIYLMVVATLVTILQMFLDKYIPDFYASAGRFIALIAVNCIILARAEAFAGKNDVLSSLVDAASMGLGFIVAIAILGGVRQLLGDVLGISIFTAPAGGFIALGLLMALFNAALFFAKGYAARREARKTRREARRSAKTVKEEAL
ncbi:MAG: electron transport complex subunit RsxE [Firmicutes bacterium]|nr:electron transport complex subunit RsxE [Bacillota bacterium]